MCPVGIPQHIIQRGNNRQVCFAREQDFSAYLSWLKDYAKKYQVWVLMTNNVHVLCAPRVDNAVSRMLQSLGRDIMYDILMSAISYQRTGTLWEGRFKSCLVQEEGYLLQLYRYIELNPVRAGIVGQPSDYVWSSYSINALDKKSELCTPHLLYLALGSEPKERQASYSELFKCHVEGALLEDIRLAINKGLVFGNERFEAEVEGLTVRRITANKMGIPVGWRKKVVNN